jgi:hypothetical protein
MKTLFEEGTRIFIADEVGFARQGNALYARTLAQYEETTGVLLVEHSITQDEGYEIDCDDKYVSRMESLLRPRSIAKATREAVTRADTWIEHTKQVANRILLDREQKAHEKANRKEVELPY